MKQIVAVILIKLFVKCNALKSLSTLTFKGKSHGRIRGFLYSKLTTSRVMYRRTLFGSHYVLNFFIIVEFVLHSYT